MELDVSDEHGCVVLDLRALGAGVIALRPDEAYRIAERLIRAANTIAVEAGYQPDK